MEFYLITGFLGAGKTTFLKNFLRLFSNKKIHLIINEFGKEGVDGTLLREVGAVLEEINNGSIFCACRLDKFEDALKSAISTNPEIIIAEASGLADPTGVKRVIGQFKEIDYKGSICLADAVRLQKVYSTAIVSQKQLAVSSLILLNKTDVATTEQCEKTKELILESNPAGHIIPTQFGHIEKEWLEYVTPNLDIEEATSKKDITLQKTSLCIEPNMPKETLYKCLTQLCESTYRMKGLVSLDEGNFWVDCTGFDVQIKPWQAETNNRIVLLAGKGMPLRKAIKTAISFYGKYIKIATDD